MPWASAGSRLALILRRLKGRYGISAPQVSVRTRVPWHWRLAGFAGAIAVLAAVVALVYDAGQRMAGFDQSETAKQVSELRATNAALEQEVGRLRSLLTARESSLEIEQASQRLLTEKAGTLTAENARLKEDLAVFERLARLEAKSDESIFLDRLSVRADTPGQYRYSFLIALQGGRRGKETKFNLQIAISRRNGNDKITLPTPDDPEIGQYEISLRNFRHIEGRFSVPAGFAVGEVEIRILEAGLLRAGKKVAL